MQQVDLTGQSRESGDILEQTSRYLTQPEIYQPHTLPSPIHRQKDAGCDAVGQWGVACSTSDRDCSPSHLRMLSPYDIINRVVEMVSFLWVGM